MQPSEASSDSTRHDDFVPRIPNVVRPASRFDLVQHLRDIYRLQGIENVLSWDQQVYMPRMAAAERARQLEWVAVEMHRRMVDPSFIDALDELWERRGTLSADELVNVRELRREAKRSLHLSDEFVAEKTHAESVCYNQWLLAREARSFKAVREPFGSLIKALRHEAELTGYDEHPYDALLEDYEPGLKVSKIKPLVLRLGERLEQLLVRIPDRFRQERVARIAANEDTQARFCADLLARVGFDFERGRLDRTLHPFQTSLGHSDLRIATNYNSDDLLSAVFSCLHEAGHAWYETGLPEEHRGTPLGSCVSLGIHESQARFWENMVGRSRSFMTFLYRFMNESGARIPVPVSAEQLWLEVNQIRPTAARVDADEVTYNLHIAQRMLLEEQLIGGTLDVADLPEAWNELNRRFFGTTPEDDEAGVLQDDHWYSGDFGYFPTYVLGNIYAASLFEAVRAEMPTLDQQIAAGDFGALQAWLGKNVHAHGMRYGAEELIMNVTGNALDEGPLVRYLEGKFASGTQDTVKAPAACELRHGEAKVVSITAARVAA